MKKTTKKAVKKSIIFLVMMITFAVLFLGCRSDIVKVDNGKLNVVTTTTVIGDATRVIGQDHINLKVLMGPGIDPHQYKASAGDVIKMQEADLIIHNGLHLEGKMGDIFEKLNKVNVKTFAVSDKVDKSKIIKSEEFEGAYDPHIWFDVEIWMDVVEGIKEQLIESDPINKEVYIENAEKYLKDLKELHLYTVSKAKEVPESRRILITAHDAFNYFARAYGFEVKGLQSMNTTSEAGTSDVRELADFITDRKIPAIFTESSVPTKNMEALRDAVRSRNYNVKIGEEIFSDSLGSPDTEEGTYVGMIRYNINTIVGELLD